MKYLNWLSRAYPKEKIVHCKRLEKDLNSDYLVVGGGFSGLHAALCLSNYRKEVVLLEKGICGNSSSGKSAGFLTPESEEDLQQLFKEFGEKKAKILYKIPIKGINMIINNVKKYNLDCDLRKQDSFYFSKKSYSNKFILDEARAKKIHKVKYNLYNREEMKNVHPGKNYLLGLRYSGSYGINSFAYCQEIKRVLLRKGVRIFENSEVLGIDGNCVKTKYGSVRASRIIFCIDKLKPEINKDFYDNYYTFQTYISVSEPIEKKIMKEIFPKGELMCWDTSWMYIYYRPIYGNRLLVGGSSPWKAYTNKLDYSEKIIKYFIKILIDSFPKLKKIKFKYFWSGLIDVTKDLIPIVDYAKENKNIQYVVGCSGLSWAAFCGEYAARRAIFKYKNFDELSSLLSLNRSFTFSKTLQNIIGKRLTFVLSHIKKYLID